MNPSALRKRSLSIQRIWIVSLTAEDTMHELSIAQSILEGLEEEQQTRGFSKVVAVNLRIGSFSNIVPESLRFCFDAVKVGTIADDAALRFTITPLVGTCTACRTRIEIEEDYFLCPHCGSVQVAVLSGEELDIISIEVEQ
jgi:hydrogenase nickel incorporation protein HypA/HybF